MSGRLQLATDANWMADSHVLLKPDEHLRFVVESMYRLSNYLFHQLPPTYTPNINRDIYYKAFSIQPVDALCRTAPSSGQDQPTRIVASPDNVENAQAILDLWQFQLKKRAAFIPFCRKSSLNNPNNTEEIVTQEKMGMRFVRDKTHLKMGGKFCF